MSTPTEDELRHEELDESGTPPEVVEDPTGPRSRRRRAPEWLVTLAVGVVTWLLGCIPRWRSDLFYYVGDQHEQIAPLWHLFGQRLRGGTWVMMDPAGWMGGNYAAEALTGLWNPVSLANFVLASHFDDLSLAAFAVSVEFLGLFAMATFLLARSHGASRWPSAGVAIALAFSGFTLWYNAAGWPYHLMGLTWVTWFWWAAHRNTRGRLNPLVPFVFGALAMTTGSPFGALGVVVVTAALCIECLVRRSHGRLLHLLVVGACVCAVALLVYLPLVASDAVSWRGGLADLSNDTFLVPDLGDLAAASTPSYLPSIDNWDGQVETKPSTYLAWFVLPLLPWLRWDRLRRRARSLTSLLAVGGFFLLATLGPSSAWLFRWPIRMLDYLYLAVLVLFAVALTAGLATDVPRRRATASAAVVGGGAYLAWAVQPGDISGVHLTALVLVAVLTALAITGGRRLGASALGVVLIAGTAAILILQTSAFPHRSADLTGPPPPDPPFDVTALEQRTSDLAGTTVQLATPEGVTTEQAQTGEIVFGNVPHLTGAETVGSYTGIGFSEFAEELCMDYRGATCSGAFDRLWAPTGEGIPVPLVDALRVSTLVVQRVLLPEVVDTPPPAGWRVAEVTAARVVWVREQPLTGGGRVSWSASGVEVLEDTAQPEREVVRYQADEAGRILFARLAWPGYTATVDGAPVAVDDGPAGLVAVEVPAGPHELVLRYESPGLGTGAVAALAAAVVAAVQAVVWYVQGRRRRS